MGGFAQSEVIVLYPDTENKDFDEAVYQKIFLAGTIDMGKSVDWQKATCDWFRALPEGRYLLFNPRRDKGLSGEMSDFEHQVNWELEHLEKADLIIMNILASSSSITPNITVNTRHRTTVFTVRQTFAPFDSSGSRSYSSSSSSNIF